MPLPDLRTALLQTHAALAARDDLRDRARLDAQQLLELATGLSRVQQLAAPQRLLSQHEVAALQSLLERRLRSEPMQHLRGSQEFYGRNFLVSPDVLIPRPETEDIVSAVLEATPDRDAPMRIADVGTGSGALAVTLALELPGSAVVALDASPAALAVAERNADALGAGARVRLIESDLLSALDPADRFDVIVSNPPYIPLHEAPTLHAQVRDYEPHLALFGGEDGNDLYRRLLPQAWDHLKDGGLLVLETGGTIGPLLDLLKLWQDVRIRKDLQGIDRTVTARRPAL